MRVFFVLYSIGLISMPVLAEQPFGWIGNDQSSAYAIGMGRMELSGYRARVNDTIDFLNLRNDLLASNAQRLVGDTGDLTGSTRQLRIGILDSLELFYRQSEQNLTINLGTISSADIENLDNGLQTERKAFGAKWVVLDSINRDRSYPWSSVAVELIRTVNRSNDFGGDLANLRTSAGGGVRFDPPGRFALDRLEDEGWQAKLLFSAAWSTTATATFWAGYGESHASSGTRWDVDIDFLRNAFLQTFDTRESQFVLGAGLNWHLQPRLPVQLGYEYTHITDREQDTFRGSSSFSRFLPSFLRGDGLQEGQTRNHSLYGSINWWVTPEVYVGAAGKLFSNQFTGIIPHYNNPLSGSFGDIPYGYLEFRIGVYFDMLNAL